MSEHSQSTMQARWEDLMDQRSRAVKHVKTSVLLLAWAPEHDDLGVSKEVSKLEEVFDKDYGFKVYNHSIDGNSKAQDQATKYLLDFVMKEDQEEGLLIIYFAGHGYSDVDTSPGDVILAGSLPAPSNNDEKRAVKRKQLLRTRIIWSQVENMIKGRDADILLIFDCCNAGRLGQKMRAPETSIFEFLGACPPEEETKGPGRDSFTHALTRVLKDFAADRRSFSTTELKDAIKAYEHFPKDQEPVLAFRGLRPNRVHIVISSKNAAADQASPMLSRAERVELKNKQYLSLRFWFSADRQIDHLESTAEALKSVAHAEEAPWDRVDFIERSSLLRKSAMKWMHLTLPGRRREQSTSTSLPVLLDNDESPGELTPCLTLQIPKTPLTPVTSGEWPLHSQSRVGWEHGEACAQREAQIALGDEPIHYHVKAIAAKLRLMVKNLLASILNMICKRLG